MLLYFKLGLGLGRLNEAFLNDKKKAMKQPPPLGHEHNVRCLIEAFFSSLEEAEGILRSQPSLLNAKTQHRRETALHYLATENHLEGVRFLLEQGAEVDTVASANDTPLMTAAQLGYPDMCRLLLAAGANVKAADESEDTVLHHASQSGCLEVFDLLLASGADSSAENMLGETAIDLVPEEMKGAVASAISHYSRGSH